MTVGRRRALGSLSWAPLLCYSTFVHKRVDARRRATSVPCWGGKATREEWLAVFSRLIPLKNKRIILSTKRAAAGTSYLCTVLIHFDLLTRAEQCLKSSKCVILNMTVTTA